jgi:hypothetical protein
MIEPDDDDDEDDDAAYDDAADETLAECPKCGASVFDDIEQCPHCGEWIDGLEYAETTRKRVFVKILAWVTVLGFLFVLLWQLLFR